MTKKTKQQQGRTIGLSKPKRFNVSMFQTWFQLSTFNFISIQYDGRGYFSIHTTTLIDIFFTKQVLASWVLGFQTTLAFLGSGFMATYLLGWGHFLVVWYLDGEILVIIGLHRVDKWHFSLGYQCIVKW